jgi:uncharacterized protein YjbI with pentapeptide repeats
MVDRPSQPADHDAKAQDRRRHVWRLAGAGLLVLGLLVVLLLACVLWIPKWLYPSLTEADVRGVSDAAKVQDLKGARLKLQNDARTTLLQGLGAVLVLTGAGIGASVTLRQIRETARANRDQLRLGEQGQLTERYPRAVEQLGHEKAPVRLGALYSLQGLAQNNLDYRQTIVDVFCAYLRMPYIPPARNDPAEQAMTPEGGVSAAHSVPGQDAVQQELQVRQTAQRLLADHLRCPPQTSGQDAQLLSPSPQQPFWPGISLDLTGAILVDLDLKEVSVIKASFSRATFQGFVRFHWATFQGDVEFDGATFQGGAWFNGATFQGGAWYTGATFQGDAWFSKATFQRAGFSRVTFQCAAWFPGATFQDAARFNEATFQRDARLPGAIFQGAVEFHGATFQGDAWFNDATFQGDNRGEGVAGAQVLRLDDSDLNQHRVWPNGFTVRPDPADPTRGTLVPAEHAEEPEPVSPPSDPTETGSGTG